MSRQHSLSLLMLTTLWAVQWSSALHASAPQESEDARSISFSSSTSTIDFTLDAVLHKVHGTAQLDTGSIRWSPTAGTCEGTIVIDATSLESGNKRRDRDMHTKVLESETYPTIEFECHRFKGKVDDDGNPGDFQAEGVFSIHGDQHSMTAPMRFERDGSRSVVSGVFEVPYVEWGMKDPSKAFLRVGKTVEITLRLVSE